MCTLSRDVILFIYCHFASRSLLQAGKQAIAADSLNNRLSVVDGYGCKTSQNSWELRGGGEHGQNVQEDPLLPSPTIQFKGILSNIFVPVLVIIRIQRRIRSQFWWMPTKRSR